MLLTQLKGYVHHFFGSMPFTGLDPPSRSEAIRRLVELGLKAKGK
jgi:hypothetical protein